MKRLLSFLWILFGLMPNLYGQSLIPDVDWSSGIHSGWIQAIAVSADESTAASAAADGTLKLWRFNDSALIATLTGHSNSVNSIAFSSDDRILVSGSGDRTIRIWQTTDGRLSHAWSEGSAGVYSVALSPDDSLVAAGSGTPGYPHLFDGAVRVWNATNGLLIRTLTNHIAQVSSVAFSPDGQLISAACVNGAVFVWRVSDGVLAWNVPGGIGGWSGKVAFSPDGQSLAYGIGEMSYVGMRRVSDGALLWWERAHYHDVHDLAFSTDSGLLVSVGEGVGTTNYPSIILWNPINGTRVGDIPTSSYSGTSVAWLGSGTHLLVSERTGSGTGCSLLRLWQMNGSLSREWNGHCSSVTALAFASDGNTLASGGSGDRPVKLWCATNGTLLHTLEGYAGTVRTIAFSPDGTKVAYGDNWSTSYIRMFRVSDGGLEWSRSVYPGSVSTVAFSPSGMVLAVGEGYSITLRHETNGLVFQTISGLTNSILALGFPTSNQVVSLTRDTSVKFWQTNGILLRSFNVKTGLSCGAFSLDGEFLAVGYTNHEVELVRLSDGVATKSFSGHLSPIIGVALSADGEMLVSAAKNELMLWRIADGAVLRQYTDEILLPASLAVSPRGDCLALGRTDAMFLVARKPDFFLPLAKPENGCLTLRFSGVSGTSYLIETSTELETWRPWTNVLCSGPVVSLDVPISVSANRFFHLTR